MRPCQKCGAAIEQLDAVCKACGTTQVPAVGLDRPELPEAEVRTEPYTIDERFNYRFLIFPLLIFGVGSIAFGLVGLGFVERQTATLVGGVVVVFVLMFSSLLSP